MHKFDRPKINTISNIIIIRAFKSVLIKYTYIVIAVDDTFHVLSRG